MSFIGHSCDNVGTRFFILTMSDKRIYYVSDRIRLARAMIITEEIKRKVLEEGARLKARAPGSDRAIVAALVETINALRADRLGWPQIAQALDKAGVRQISNDKPFTATRLSEYYSAIKLAAQRRADRARS